VSNGRFRQGQDTNAGNIGWFRAIALLGFICCFEIWRSRTGTR